MSGREVLGGLMRAGGVVPGEAGTEEARVMEDRLVELRSKARRWLPLVRSDPESVRQLRQMIDDDLDGMPAVCLMAVKMVTGALREEGGFARLKKHSLKRESNDSSPLEAVHNRPPTWERQ